MQNNTHILIDGPFLCYVSFYGARGMIMQPSEHLRGMVDRARTLVERYESTRVLFCFDGPPPLHRATMYGGYKGHREAARKQKDPMELLALDNFRAAMHAFPTLLESMGFAVACQPGYEADDLIAEAVLYLTLDQDPDVILVSSDEDMFQLLLPGVTMVTPAGKDQVRNGSWLYETHGVGPHQWAEVKAIAGCSSDNVPGVPGVGNKTAAKYLRGELKATTKAFQSIELLREDSRNRLPLVRLPWPHAKLPDDWMCPSREWTKRKFRDVLGELEYRSQEEAIKFEAEMAGAMHDEEEDDAQAEDDESTED